MNLTLPVKVLLCFVIAVIAIQFVVAFTESLRFLHKFFMLRQKDLSQSYGKHTWAVITGGSSGQGKEFAKQLAAHGFHIVLIGSKRSHAVAAEVRAASARQVIVIEKDFSQAFDPHFFDDVEEVVSKLDCSILVNNVGHRTGWIPYHKQPVHEIRDTIACGTLVQARMTHLMIPLFEARAASHRSAVVFITAQCMHPNFGFAAGLRNEISIPFMSVYEASNSFGYYHACSIVKEYRTTPWLDILNITPGAVITENTKDMLADTPFAVSAHTFVQNIIRFMGGNVNGTTCAHWGHSISNGCIALAPFCKDIILEKVGRRIALHCMQKHRLNSSTPT